MIFSNIFLRICRELCAARRTEISFERYKQDGKSFKRISSKKEVYEDLTFALTNKIIWG